MRFLAKIPVNGRTMGLHCEMLITVDCETVEEGIEMVRREIRVSSNTRFAHRADEWAKITREG